MDVRNLTVIFSKLSRIQTKEINEILDKYGLTLFYAQYLLIFNGLDKEFTLSEITDLVDTNKSSTTRAIKSMISKGLIKKVSNDIKRGYSLELTNKGNEITEAISKEILEYHLSMFSVLENKEEEKQLIYLIDKLLNKLNDSEFKF